MAKQESPFWVSTGQMFVYVIIPFYPSLYEFHHGQKELLTREYLKGVPLFVALDLLRTAILHAHYIFPPEQELPVRIAGAIGYSMLGLCEYLYHANSSHE